MLATLEITKGVRKVMFEVEEGIFLSVRQSEEGTLYFSCRKSLNSQPLAESKKVSDTSAPVAAEEAHEDDEISELMDGAYEAVKAEIASSDFAEEAHDAESDVASEDETEASESEEEGASIQQKGSDAEQTEEKKVSKKGSGKRAKGNGVFTNPENLEKLKQLYNAGVKWADIAEEFGVSKGYCIKALAQCEGVKKERIKAYTPTAEEAAEIEQRYADGESINSLARSFGVTNVTMKKFVAKLS